MWQLIFYIGLGLFFILMGFLMVRYPMLISGYNTLPKYKRDKIDIRPYTLFARRIMIVMGAIIIVGSLLLYIGGLVDWGVIFLLK
ncbi:DUF3784 domain-containing protein [Massilibacteroides sp.]|uniref:DUF3784 domain-containing protein n=1 Tax=Massilibacteroides sp. TaxID=2034766 RepID=UPI002620DF04|nr:DUF3784 domain-containing protein [Massilibacteroides sp.]MDD4514163.1 DUF3784 domain-containing protein [Massilibacteroides sp.]